MSAPSNFNAEAVGSVRDDELVSRTRDGDRWAFEELARRYEPRHRAQVRKLIRRRALTAADRPDAMNVALIGLFIATARFDLVQAGRPAVCSFGSFAWKAVHDPLRNFVRQERRAERRLDRSQSATTALQKGSRL